MNSRQLLILLILILSSIVANAQWNRVQHPLGPLYSTYFDLIDYDTISVRTDSGLFISYNNGLQWKQILSVYNGDQFIWNTSQQLIVEGYSSTGPNNLYTLYSDNGGLTFDTLRKNEFDPRPYFLYKPRIGFSENNRPYILKRSINSDTLFRYQISSIDTILLPTNTNFNDQFTKVLYLNGNSIVLWADSSFTENHRIYRTTNLGARWQRTVIPSGSRIVDIQANGFDSLIWIFGDTIMKSADGGQTHQTIPIPIPNHYCAGISFKNDVMGVSLNNNRPSRTFSRILKSNDFLNSWTIDSLPNQRFEEVYQVELLDTSYGWTSGFLVLYGLDNRVSTSLKTKPDNRMFNIYPNPTPSQVNLIGTENENYKSFTVFNLTGEIVFEGKIPLNKSIRIPTKLPDGIYFIRLIGEGQISSSVKLIKN